MSNFYVDPVSINPFFAPHVVKGAFVLFLFFMLFFGLLELGKIVVKWWQEHRKNERH